MFRLLSRIPLSSHKTISAVAGCVSALALFFGLIFTAAWTVDTKEECTGHLWMKECETVAVDTTPWLVAAIVAFTIAIVIGSAAVTLYTTQGRLKKYLPILKGVEQMDIRQIADITGNTWSTVYRDLETLINSDMVDDLYIDYGRQQVVSKRYIPGASHKTVVRCTNCRANNELIVGITKACAYCREPLLL